MITVKLYGLLRIESGIKEKQLEAAAVKEVLDQLVACGIDRKDRGGYCRAAQDFLISRAALHAWEEPCISGKNGSGTVFFAGCNLRCPWCHNPETVYTKGRLVTIDSIVD